MEAPDDGVIRAYLLGEMNTEERCRFQQRLFEDDELFARVCGVEQDLTDALARGELPPEVAAQVRAFLSESAQQERLAFADALARTERRSARKGRQQWMLPLAVCIVLGMAALLLALRNRNLERQVAQMPPGAAASAGPVYVANLSPGAVRGSGERRAIRIPRDRTIVELRLQLRAPGNFSQYRADVNGAGGRPVMSMLVPGPLGVELPLAISRIVLSGGEYEIGVSGIQPDGQPQAIDYYYFTLK